MTSPSRRRAIDRAKRGLDPHATPLWFKLWFALLACVGVGLLGLVVWLILAAISWLERQP